MPDRRLDLAVPATVDQGFFGGGPRTDNRARLRRMQQGVIDAEMRADGGVADACDLQILDRRTWFLRIASHRGFLPAFLEYFAAVDAAVPSACGTALATGDPVLIDDITTSAIFAGRPTLEPVLAGRHPGRERLAWTAAQAMARVEGPSPATAECYRPV